MLLLGILFDCRLNYSCHIRSMEVRASQRLGFFRRACSLLRSIKAREIVYKGFIRPLLEYAPLVWMSAPSANRLDAIQARALRIIGGLCFLDTLSHRRKVAGLTYLYKLRCGDVPQRLLDMIPPPLPEPTVRNIQTRGSELEITSWHPFLLRNPLKHTSLELIRNSFPYCLIKDWNNLPLEFFDGCFKRSKLQRFKTSVHHFLRHSNVPCLV